MYAIVIGVSSLAPLAIGAALVHSIYRWCRLKLYQRSQSRMWYRQPGMSDWGW